MQQIHKRRAFQGGKGGGFERGRGLLYPERGGAFWFLGNGSEHHAARAERSKAEKGEKGFHCVRVAGDYPPRRGVMIQAMRKGGGLIISVNIAVARLGMFKAKITRYGFPVDIIC